MTPVPADGGRVRKGLTNGQLRLITGTVYAIVLLLFFVLKIFVHKLFFDVLIVLFTVLGTHEMIRAFGDKLHRSQKIVAMVFSQLCVLVYIIADVIFTDYLGVGFPEDVYVVEPETCLIVKLGTFLAAMAQVEEHYPFVH